MKIRRFQIAAGKHLVLPLGLLPGPGATNMRLHSSAIVELDFDDRRTQLHGRFIANRVKLGDLVEVGPEVKAPELTAEPVAEAPSRPFAVNPPAGGK